MGKKKTANDKAWVKLFDHFAISEVVAGDGHFDLSATQIKEVGGREARLMCKMDFRQSVAEPFKDAGLSILAISNGHYRIAPTSPFFDIDLGHVAQVEVQDFTLPPHLETLSHDNITNESQALDAAAASGMLSELLGEDSDLTVRGRRYSTAFEIELPTSEGSVTYPIQSVQIEVDGGYEGRKVLALIEAKMGTADNMNMRQLVYPHAHFESYLKKPVKTFLMFYEPGSLFTFIPMMWDGAAPELRYQDSVRYRLVTPGIAEPEDESLPKGSINYDAPSPQADDFAKILFGLARLGEIQPASKEELFSQFAIVPRQYDYYFNAMRWLGVAQREGKGTCSLTPLGEKLMSLSERQRISALRAIMLTDPVFQKLNENSEYTASRGEKALWKVNETTYRRRRSTALAWLNATAGLPLGS